MPHHLIPRECTATLPSSSLPDASASPLARFGQHDGPALRRGLRSSHLLLGGRRQITCVQVLGQTRLATAISIDRSYGRLYHLPEPPANAMTDVTPVVLLSVRGELWSEYAELFFDIFCVLPQHSCQGC